LQQSGIPHLTNQQDGNLSGLFNIIRYAAIITACAALILALLISAIKKKRRNINETKTPDQITSKKIRWK
jgi:hypothetical protein